MMNREEVINMFKEVLEEVSPDIYFDLFPFHDNEEATPEDAETLENCIEIIQKHIGRAINATIVELRCKKKF